jgi:hypothetical protein
VQIDWAFLRDLRLELYQEIKKTMESAFSVSTEKNHENM